MVILTVGFVCCVTVGFMVGSMDIFFVEFCVSFYGWCYGWFIGRFVASLGCRHRFWPLSENSM